MIVLYDKYIMYKHPATGDRVYFAQLRKDKITRPLRKQFTRARDAVQHGKAVASRFNHIKKLEAKDG